MIQRFRRSGPISLVAVVVLAFGTAQLFAGAVEAGVTTDEPIHTERTEAWLDTGWYVPSTFLADGDPDPGNEFSTPFVYGPATASIAHLANAAFGNEAFDEVAHSSSAYIVRHLTVALLAAIAVAAVGAAAWTLTGSRAFGLWTAAALLAVPRWMGHAFFNFKDVPAGAGYTMVTAALVLALYEDPERPAGRLRKAAIGALVAGGIFVGAGTRLSLWVPLLISLLAYAALRLGQHFRAGVARNGDIDFAVVVGTIVGVGAIGAIYPNVTTTPLELLSKSVSNSVDFPYGGFTLTAGELLSEHPPRWYMPAWLGGTFPLLLGVLAVVGAVAGLRRVLVRRGRAIDLRWGGRELGLLLVLLQLTLLPAGALIKDAVVYNGLRQHLYLLPAIVILAGLGARYLWDWADRRRDPRRWRTTATIVLAAALVVPMAEQTMLFPYNYAYVNPAGGIGGVNDRWETDYWFASAPEALARVPRGVELRCSFFLVPGWEPDDDDPTLTPCEGDQYKPFTERRGTETGPEARSSDRAIWVIARKRGANHPPAYCEEVDDVTRRLRGEDVTMAFVLRCDRARARAAEERP